MLTVVNYASAEFVVLVGTILLLTLLLGEMCDWINVFFAYENCLYNYSYNEISGPLTWKDKFPESRGKRQSPINISCDYAVVVPAETLQPLRFSAEYQIPPRDLRVYNDGHCVTLCACWDNNAKPTICGGHLRDSYEFFNARFRWGPTDDDGSEHSVDCQKYALELQVMHIKKNARYRNVKEAAEDNGVLILSYLFEVACADNPSLTPLISALKNIRCAFNCVSMDPFPLDWFMPPFPSKYFTYRGSLTYPPCTEGVRWMIQPEPLTISAKQVRKFRKICGVDGPIITNTRPLQDVNCRQIFFYD